MPPPHKIQSDTLRANVRIETVCTRGEERQELNTDCSRVEEKQGLNIDCTHVEEKRELNTDCTQQQEKYPRGEILPFRTSSSPHEHTSDSDWQLFSSSEFHMHG